jgi:hypothetical protein
MERTELAFRKYEVDLFDNVNLFPNYPKIGLWMGCSSIMMAIGNTSLGLADCSESSLLGKVHFLIYL